MSVTDKVGIGSAKGLLAGARAGHYTLPNELLEAEETIGRLEEALSNARSRRRENPNSIETALIANAVERASSNVKNLVDAARYEKAVVESQRFELEQRVLQAALDRARRNLVAITSQLADVIVDQHLRRPFLKNLSDARPHAEILEGVVDAHGALGRGDEGARAWRVLERHADVYGAHRRAWRACWDMAFRSEVDDPGLAIQFSTMRNLGAVFPMRHKTPEDVPWPRDPTAYLIWALTSDPRPELWLPTSDDFEEAFATERTRINRVQNRQSNRTFQFSN